MAMVMVIVMAMVMVWAMATGSPCGHGDGNVMDLVTGTLQSWQWYLSWSSDMVKVMVLLMPILHGHVICHRNPTVMVVVMVPDILHDHGHSGGHWS